MKRVFTLSLIAIAQIAQANYLEEMFSNSELSGNLRFGAISNSYEDNSDDDGYSIGGKLGFLSDTKKEFGVGATFYTSNPINSFMNDNKNGDFFDENSKGYTILGESFISAKFMDSELKLGRFELDTPLLNSDDIRMVPNTFEGVYFESVALENLTLRAFYISKMSGWENEANSKKFVDIMSVIGVNDKNSIYGASFDYTVFEGLTFSLWDYYLENVTNALYSDLSYEKELETITFNTAIQYQLQKSVGDELLGKQNASMFGLSAGVLINATDTTLLVAYNKGNGEELIEAFGGAPMFSSYFDELTPNNGANSKAIAGGVEQELLEDLSIGLYYGEFKADEFKSEEFDIALNYEFDNFSIGGVALFVNDKLSNSGFDGYRAFINYSF